MNSNLLTYSDHLKCPCGGEVIINQTQNWVRNSDQPLVTLGEIENALIRPGTCKLPVLSGGPCTQLMCVFDPLPVPLRVQGRICVSDKVVAITDRGFQMMVSPCQSRRLQLALSLSDVSPWRLNVASSAAPRAFAEENGKALLSCSWDATFVEIGESVSMMGRSLGISDQTPVTFRIYQIRLDGTLMEVDVVHGEIVNNEFRCMWKLSEGVVACSQECVVSGAQGNYSSLQYLFETAVEEEDLIQNELTSLPLTLVDWVELQLVDDEGEPVTDGLVELRASDGTRLNGRPDECGVCRFKGLLPGEVTVQHFPGR